LLKRSITYASPFDEDKKITGEFYFHISKADMVRMEVEGHKERHVDPEGNELTGWRAKMQRIVDAGDGKAVMAELEDIICRSHGHRDGDRFLRTPEILADFRGSGAYDQLLYDLCTDVEVAAEFVNGVFPSNLAQVAAEVAERAEQEMAAANAGGAVATSAPEPPQAEPDADSTGLTEPVTPRVLTQTEVTEMDAAELKAGLADGRYKLS